jgi:hypothetical protein
MKEREMNAYETNEKLEQLIRILEADRGHSFTVGWLKSMLSTIVLDLSLTKKQTQKLNELLETNSRWAQTYKG